MFNRGNVMNDSMVLEIVPAYDWFMVCCRAQGARDEVFQVDAWKISQNSEGRETIDGLVMCADGSMEQAGHGFPFRRPVPGHVLRSARKGGHSFWAEL